MARQQIILGEPPRIRLRRKDWNAALDSVRATARTVLSWAPIIDADDLDTAIEDFVRRLDESASLRRFFKTEKLATTSGVLEALIAGELERLRRQQRQPEAAEIPSAELRRRGTDLAQAAKWLREPGVGPGDPPLADAVERFAQRYNPALLFQLAAEIQRRRPKQKPRTPLGAFAAAVDPHLTDRDRPKADHLIAQLAAEVLGAEADPERVRLLLKGPRRARARA